MRRRWLRAEYRHAMDLRGTNHELEDVLDRSRLHRVGC